MPRYKREYVIEHYLVKVEETGIVPVIHLALYKPDVPYALPLVQWPPEEVFAVLLRAVKEHPKDRWHSVSVKIEYRKHLIDRVTLVEAETA